MAKSNTTTDDQLQDLREMLAELIEVTALAAIATSPAATDDYRNRAVKRLLQKSRL